jgi:hypothetical protein
MAPPHHAGLTAVRALLRVDAHVLPTPCSHPQHSTVLLCRHRQNAGFETNRKGPLPERSLSTFLVWPTYHICGRWLFSSHHSVTWGTEYPWLIPVHCSQNPARVAVFLQSTSKHPRPERERLLAMHTHCVWPRALEHRTGEEMIAPPPSSAMNFRRSSMTSGKSKSYHAARPLSTRSKRPWRLASTILV